MKKIGKKERFFTMRKDKEGDEEVDGEIDVKVRGNGRNKWRA